LDIGRSYRPKFEQMKVSIWLKILTSVVIVVMFYVKKMLLFLVMILSLV